MKTTKYKIIYDLLMIVLAITTIVFLIIDSTTTLSEAQSNVINIIDTAILIIFAVDYFIRLIISKEKKQFFRKNIPDLISIIPFSQVFQALRIFRVFRIIQVAKLARLGKAARVFSLFAKFTSRASDFLRTNSFIYITYIAGGSILFGTIGISYVENMSFGDALWWSIVTTTTVGYGDISPKTGLGKLIAAILMFVGIGFLGMLTGTISTYFLRKVKPKPDKCDSAVSLDGLSDADIISVENYIDFLKSRNN